MRTGRTCTPPWEENAWPSIRPGPSISSSRLVSGLSRIDRFRRYEAHAESGQAEPVQPLRASCAGDHRAAADVEGGDQASRSMGRPLLGATDTTCRHTDIVVSLDSDPIRCENAGPFLGTGRVTYSFETYPVSCRSVWSPCVTTHSGVLHGCFCGLKAGTCLDTRLALG